VLLYYVVQAPRLVNRALEAGWRSRVLQSGQSALSNTLSLLDSTIVAIDSAISPASSSSCSKVVSTSAHSRLFHADFRRPDVISPNSGLRLSEMYPWRYDSGIATASSSWRGKAWSRRTQVDNLLPMNDVQLDTRQHGTVITATYLTE